MISITDSSYDMCVCVVRACIWSKEIFLTEDIPSHNIIGGGKRKSWIVKHRKRTWVPEVRATILHAILSTLDKPFPLPPILKIKFILVILVHKIT